MVSLMDSSCRHRPDPWPQSPPTARPARSLFPPNWPTLSPNIQNWNSPRTFNEVDMASLYTLASCLTLALTQPGSHHCSWRIFSEDIPCSEKLQLIHLNISAEHRLAIREANSALLLWAQVSLKVASDSAANYIHILQAQMRSQLSLFMKFIDSPISFSPGQVLPQSPSLLPWFHLASQAEKVFCLQDPGPIKCLRAPSHQILAKSAPQKRVIATKWNSRQKCVNQI